MKNKYNKLILLLVCISLMMTAVYFLVMSGRTDEKMDVEGRIYTQMETISTIDETGLVDIFKYIADDSVSVKNRKLLLDDFFSNGNNKNFESLKSTYLFLKSLGIQQWLKDSPTQGSTPSLLARYHLFNHICEILGRSGVQEATELLTNECKPENWDSFFQTPNIRNLSAEVIVDSYFRLYVFKGLLASAINKPELFDVIEKYDSNFLRGTEDNVKSWFIDFKEEYYRLNPLEIPAEGYIKLKGFFKTNIDSSNIFLLNIRIGEYARKHKKLPSTILDLTIPKGGDYVYIPVDQNKNEDNNFYEYRTFRDGNRLMYILSSVGPNKKLDIPLDRLKVGTGSIFHGMPNASQEDIDQAKKIFPELQDEVFCIVTYTINE